MSAPSLPQHDPDPARRRQLLERARDGYDPDPSRLPPFVLPRELPPAEARGGFADRLAAALLPANFAAVKLRTLIDAFDELQDYEDVFKVFDVPAVIRHWRRDAMFAEQRVAGVEARALRRVDRLPPHLRLDPRRFAAIAGVPLDRAAAEGRLSVADYALLDGVAPGDDDGPSRFLYAPLALFCWRDEPGSEDMSRETPRRGALVPVAIQLDQRPRPGNLYTPQDGPAWLLARTAVQAADHAAALLGHHFARVHLGMAGFATATARQLAPTHPLAALLRPHLRGALAQAEQTRRRLVEPGGPLARLLAPGLAGALEVAARSYRAWDFGAWALPRDLAARGLADPEELPHYPLRDDGLRVWSEIAAFVDAYLALFYADDGELAADPELRAWLDELADPARGAVPGLPAAPTRAALAELVTTALFTAGPDHAALGDRLRAYATYVPNYPLALYGPVPPADAAIDDADAALMAVLPPQDQALAQLELVRLLTADPPAPFGHYGDDDPLLCEPERVHELVTGFQERLASVEGELLRRDAAREFPYRAMLPSRAPNSAGV